MLIMSELQQPDEIFLEYNDFYCLCNAIFNFQFSINVSAFSFNYWNFKFRKQHSFQKGIIAIQNQIIP
jgi:hypothetical protein